MLKATPDRHSDESRADLFSESIYKLLLPANLHLIPGLNEVYELELAFYESKVLTDDEIIRRGAYFAQVGERPTYHSLICGGEALQLPRYSSARLRSFFESKQFKTGYATHGLFPYRGKFHPQMIKALINIMGLKPGDTILDPMMGSGTVLIEACLMGIRSLGVDTSPFCRFMAQAKLDGLIVSLEPIRAAVKNFKLVFQHFQQSYGHAQPGTKIQSRTYSQFLQEPWADYSVSPLPGATAHEHCESNADRNLLLLAYLDSAGYSERSTRNSPYEQFRSILKRYLFAVEKIQSVLERLNLKPAQANPLEGDARCLPLSDSSVDGILFSPPYSFAVDYLANDSFHLKCLGADLNALREKMIGLRGKNARQKLEFYRSDMETVLAECARVLRRGRFCTIIVGTNDNQIGRILQVSPGSVPGIDEMLIEISARYGFQLALRLGRQITGIANTMRTEYIIVLERK
ncbi:MAG TPA: DNA methyltransferase [Syntrophobacteraceae bacterium]|nr:DNA methyltransferase [Syntrophobacteraceae bacterium]